MAPMPFAEIRTIAAPATPPGRSALAVIRISGPEAAQFCDELFKPGKSFPRPSSMKPYTIAFGSWMNAAGEKLDEVVLAAFRAPQSYTGEDVYEISCHGGPQIVKTVMESLMEVGAAMASAGEFTRQAFLNGKMDLTQAEAVMDLIDSESGLEQDTALREMDGILAQALRRFKEALLAVQAKTELILDFEEEDADPGELRILLTEVEGVKEDILNLLSTWKQGRVLREGYRVVIAGLPNAGKSSLLNRFLGENRAIVTEVAGTTRDTLEEKISLNGVPVWLTDTAGLHDSDDKVEQEGIRRAEEAVKKADLLLWILDPERQEESLTAWENTRQLMSPESKLIFLLGKADLDLPVRYHDLPGPLLHWSSQDENALDSLRKAIISTYEEEGGQQEVLLHNLRHQACLEEAASHLTMAIEGMEKGLSLDLFAGMLRAALEALARLTGESVSEEIAEAIFSRFCVGK